jgi:uncharacterized protein (TIGR03067 family)
VIGTFVEQTRNKEYVQMFDKKRNLEVRLYADHQAFKGADSKKGYEKGVNGHWDNSKVEIELPDIEPKTYLTAEPLPAKDATQKALDELQGTWLYVRSERNGKDIGRLKEEAGENITLLIVRDRYVRLKGGKDLWNGGTVKMIDPNSNPRKLDLTFDRGHVGTGTEASGQVGHYIWRIDGDALHLVHGKMGMDRPTTFDLKGKGSTVTLDVFKRYVP